MKRSLASAALVAVALIVLAVSARTAEEEPWVQQQQMPPFLAQEDWCLERRPTSPPSRFGAVSTYKAVRGCKSFVVKQDTLVWNGNVSCKITSIAELGGNWWLRGYCSDRTGASYVGDFRFAEGHIGGEHVLIQRTPPYAASPR